MSLENSTTDLQHFTTLFNDELCRIETLTLAIVGIERMVEAGEVP